MASIQGQIASIDSHFLDLLKAVLEPHGRARKSAAGRVDKVHVLTLFQREHKAGHQRARVRVQAIDQSACLELLLQPRGDPLDLRIGTIQYRSERPIEPAARGFPCTGSGGYPKSRV